MRRRARAKAVGVLPSPWGSARRRTAAVSRDGSGGRHGACPGAGPGRPVRPPAGCAAVTAVPGQRVEDTAVPPRRAFETRDGKANAGVFVKGSYEITAGRPIGNRRPAGAITV
ncbi:hypothetical protein GCM10010389_09810 [Streptomyces echinoruber]|uniref:Uncharacterized protein n=1 Tax=Streptomyces echinoruber TaxID=68898 RepID=A0A918QWQ9_9ACTN|nr:hypothetical protein GCM10010389_09810 [Streptomyces echinoruber]